MRSCIAPEWRLNNSQVVAQLKRDGVVFLKAEEETKKRQGQRGAISYDARGYGLQISITTGWMRGDEWFPVKRGPGLYGKPEGGCLYLRVAIHGH